MNKIFKFAAFVLAIAGLASSCVKNDIDTDQLPQDRMFLSAMAPVPVVRGAELRIYGTGLDRVAGVEIPGVSPITEIERISSEGKVKEIRVTVPKEGPVEGKVSIVDKDGNRSTSRFNLTYDETALVFDGFEAAEVVMPGDVITIKGDYINTVKEVVFAGGADGNGSYAVGDAITEQDRHSAKVVVPFDAITGKIKIGTINEVSDKNSIPTVIPSEKELVVGEPTVNPIGELRAKAGDAVLIEGEYLNMINTIAFEGAAAEDFEVNSSATAIAVTVPAEAKEGGITLTSYAGKDYVPEGTFIPVLPGGLAIAADNPQGRFKAGLQVALTGENLSIVSAISFSGIDVTSFSFTAGEVVDGSEVIPIDTIRCIIPETAPDGDVVVKMSNGSTVTVKSLEYVKPSFTDVGPSSIVARESFDLRGADLELIKGLTIGGVECQFKLDSIGVVPGFDEDNQPIEIPVYDSTLVHVTTAPDILSGDVVITLANGFQSAINTVSVSYDEAVSITFKSPSIQLGNPLAISGENLFMIEAISIKGKKVTNYVTKSNSEMSFYLPDGVGPGNYRLELVLIDGSKLTWAIPFELTAPYTETFLWEGYEDLGNWSNQPYIGAESAFVDAGIAEGDMVRIYYTPLAEWWQFQTIDGHWGDLLLNELSGGKTVSPQTTTPAEYFSFEVTKDVLKQLTSVQGWGGAMTCNGEGVAITGLSLIKWGAAEKVNVIWSGSSTVTWSGGAVTALSWGGYDWSTVAAGTKIRAEFSVDDPSGVIRFGNGSWAALPSSIQFGDAEGNIPISGLTSFDVELAAADLAELVNNGGLVICGTGFTITSISLVEAGGPAAIEATLWEGEELVDDWSVQPYLLSDGGAELKEAGATAGQQVRFYITPTEDAWKLQIFEGHWGPTYCSYCSVGNDTEDGKFAEYDLDANKGFIAITLTQEMLDTAFSVGNWGGVFVGNGDNVKITKITLF